MTSISIARWNRRLRLLLIGCLALSLQRQHGGVVAFPTSRIASPTTNFLPLSHSLSCSFPKHQSKELGSNVHYQRKNISLNSINRYLVSTRNHSNSRTSLKATAAAAIANSATAATAATVTPLSLSTAVATAAATRGIGSFFLTRILFLRGLAFVYFVAFLIAYHQNKALIGDNGITPGEYVYVCRMIDVI